MAHALKPHISIYSLLYIIPTLNALQSSSIAYSLFPTNCVYILRTNLYNFHIWLAIQKYVNVYTLHSTQSHYHVIAFYMVALVEDTQ